MCVLVEVCNNNFGSDKVSYIVLCVIESVLNCKVSRDVIVAGICTMVLLDGYIHND